MGSQLSQSQQFKKYFPLSQYKILPTDKNFPQLTFLQKLSDNSVFAVKVIDKIKQNYQPSNSKHVIKRVQRKQIEKKVFQIYQWANANVQGLVEYINFVDKNRKISKSQFTSIVQGAVRGYSSISKQCFQIQCLEIDMRRLRIFNEISLKEGNDSKQIVNSILIKTVPKNFDNNSLKQNINQQKLWGHVGSCIHKGGILTQKQLLGEYLLQISNYATKQDFKHKNDSLKNLAYHFGNKLNKVISALLSNQDWKAILKILDSHQQKQNFSPSFQKQNNKKEECKNENLILKNKQNKNQTQKTIDTEKQKSEKILFQCFKDQQRKPKQLKKQSSIGIFQDRSRVNSTTYYKSLSPIKVQKYVSPPSLKIIQQKSPPAISKQSNLNDDYNNIDNLKLTRTNSILTIYPDVFREQLSPRSRILSSKNVPIQVVSPQRKLYTMQTINSPRIKSPKYQKVQNQNSQKLFQQIQKRKGKKIQLKSCKQNNRLKQITIPNYLCKIKVDKIQTNKCQTNDKTQKEKCDTFLSQQFNQLKFDLCDKLFSGTPKNNKFFTEKHQNHNDSKTPKIQTKPNVKPSINNLQQKNHQNNETKKQHIHDHHIKQHCINSPKQHCVNHPKQHHFSIHIKQANSQTILIDPQNTISFKKAQNNQHKTQQKQSKYIGPLNIKGQKQGQGRLYFASGGFYIGTFYKDFMHGNGQLFYPSGKIAYEGTFKYDKFHGLGKLYNQNPCFISSFDFRNFNKLEVTQKQQPTHKQHYLISPRHRQNKKSYWKYYEGEMNYDMKHGKGVLVLENGEKYEGQFKDDLVNGKGTFYGQNGKISGRWQDNLLVQVYR